MAPVGGAGGAGDSETDLGSAYIQIKIDLSSFQSSLSDVSTALNRGLDDMASRFSKVGTGFRNVGLSLGLALAPALEFGRQGIEVAREFELLMSQIRVYGQLSVEQMERVRQTSLDLALSGRFGPNAVAEAFLELTKAGLNFTDTMAVLQPTLDLATGSFLGLERATTIVVAALTQFELDASQAAYVTDLLTQAASASIADVDTLADGLRLAGPVAHQFGISLEDTLAILAQFSQVGIQGARAGTQLRAMLLNMNRDTKAVTEAWEELNVSLYDAAGAPRDLNEVFTELGIALRDLPINEQNRLIQALAGTYGIVGFNALLVSQGFNTMKESMQGMAGSAEVADEMLNTFDGDVQRLQASVQVLQLFALEPLMKEALRPLIQTLTQVVQYLAAWIQANPEAAAQIVRIIGVAGALAGVMTTVGLALNAVGTAIKGFALIFGGALGPITLVIAALSALAWAYNTNFLGIGDALEPLVTRIGEALGRILGGFADFQLNLENYGLAGAISGIISPVIALLTGQEWTDAFDDARDTIQRFFNVISSAWDEIRPGLEEIRRWFLEDALPEIQRFIRDDVQMVIDNFINILAGIWIAIQPALEDVREWFVDTEFPAIGRAIDQVASTIQEWIGIVEGIWQDIQPFVQPIINEFNRIKDGVLRALQPIINFLQDIVNRAIDTINMLGQIGASVTGRPYTQIPHVDWLQGNISSSGQFGGMAQQPVVPYGPGTINVYVRPDEVTNPATAKANGASLGTVLKGRLAMTGY